MGSARSDPPQSMQPTFGALLRHARALRTLHAMGHVAISHQALCGLAGLAGELAHALRLVSVAESLSAKTGVLPPPLVQTRIKQVQTAARQALSPETQAAAWVAGQTMTMEQVIAEASQA
jgi:hypothetical protein